MPAFRPGAQFKAVAFGAQRFRNKDPLLSVVGPVHKKVAKKVPLVLKVAKKAAHYARQEGGDQGARCMATKAPAKKAVIKATKSPAKKALRRGKKTAVAYRCVRRLTRAGCSGQAGPVTSRLLPRRQPPWRP